ncbi:MAG TPA: hypothetical protein VGL29_10250 [Blastocatellia bacterium]|jgi:hypothetical protein
MSMMTKEEARRFKEGWRLVNEFTNEEARRKTVSQRLRELEMLYEFGKEMGWTKSDNEQEEVWARWNRLREIAGV